MKTQVTALQASDAQQGTQIAGLQSGVTALQNNSLLQLAGKISYNSASNAVVFSGVDVQIINGLGSTASYNGTGNLIIGYENRMYSAFPSRFAPMDRTSHKPLVQRQKPGEETNIRVRTI